MALPVSFYTETIADNTVRTNGNPEKTTWSVPVHTLTAANLVAQTALIASLKTAVDGIIIGNVLETTVVQDRVQVSSLPASSNLAQRENKYLLRYHGNTLFQKFQISIGTADLTILPNHEELLDLTAGPGLALKTAFEAIVVSPDDSSEAVTLDSAQFVGRNT